MSGRKYYLATEVNGMLGGGQRLLRTPGKKAYRKPYTGVFTLIKEVKESLFAQLLLLICFKVLFTSLYYKELKHIGYLKA